MRVKPNFYLGGYHGSKIIKMSYIFKREMFHVYTIATNLKRAKCLLDSAKLFNMNIKIINPTSWKGNYDKMLYMLKEIKNLPDNDIILFVDAYDVIITGSIEEIKEKYLSMNCDLLVSAENNCFPRYYTERYDQFLETTDYEKINTSFDEKINTSFRYLNSGGYVGTVKAIKDLYSWKTLDEMKVICVKGSDQAYFMEYYLSNPMLFIFKIDTECKIFQSMYRTSWKDFVCEGGRIFNKVLNQRPCMLHFNATSYSCIETPNAMPNFIEKIKKSNGTNFDDLHQKNETISQLRT